MFTEYEIETMVELPEVLEATQALKKDFCKNEAPYLEISDHDFFSLIMMAPTVGIALADGTVSLFEELALNKKARKLSKGGYFMKKDPVVYAMKFLLKKYDIWSDKFFNVLKVAMHVSFDMERLEKKKFDEEAEVTYPEYKKAVLNTPYILIRFIASFFLENDEEIISTNRHIGRNEYLQMLKIGEQMGLNKLPVFQMFCKTFDQKA
ncbi:MAG: hypothetical protein RIC30_02985 [Marinoscillum sp.]|jgi:hypothetical protein|uniref:Uncharacterized protein n=1 Tax=Marinoscillum luteum TaxID=861051 RepID=A0ABW7N719_9BACT|nr:hypothetical protein [Marinoscillum sp. 108]VXD11769.1 conserved hypothetical protein [Marinoscillum sp. 108]